MKHIQKVVKLTLFTLLLTFILSGCGSTSTNDLGGDSPDDNITTGTEDNNTITGTEDNSTIAGTDDNNTIIEIDDTHTDSNRTITGQVIDGEISGAIVF